MKKTKTQKHTQNTVKKTQKNSSLKMKHAGGHSFGKSLKKHPLGHLRSSLIEDQDCLSRL